MATPPLNQDAIRINAPLNFRHTDTLITTKVPHYPTKVTTGVSIIPGWNRPNANGQNANIVDKDYNGPDFKARPLKHWRRQLRVYNYKGPANNSRTANISQLERPGLTVYHFTPDCTCVPGEGGNSYIISNNQFGYETKDDNYSKGVIDVQINNNGYVVVPYDATEAQINDPTNPAYKVLTGIYNTNCINCSPQGNLIKSGIAFQSQAFYSYSNDKLESRCQTYEQNISTNKAPGCNYFDANGIPLWPNDSPYGPQVYEPVNYGRTIYNSSYFELYNYAYTSTAGPSNMVLSASFIPKVKCNPVYLFSIFYVNILPAASIEATIYDSVGNIICKSIGTQYSYLSPASLSNIFFFPKNIFIEPTESYYVTFKSTNGVNFYWFVNSSNILSGVLTAEPLYCLSQTIYKPNNVGFGRQGAVSGSTRLKKLVSDTITMNGTSFYSAMGAQEANIGKYQGTNISSNYYIKIKPGIDSCIGTVPGKLLLEEESIDYNDITVDWIVKSNGGCPILYYTLTYYPIVLTRSINQIGFVTQNEDTYENIDNTDIIDNIEYTNEYNFISTSSNDNYEVSTTMMRDFSNATSVTIYPSNNDIFTVTGLTYNTYYNMYITATNGNGESQRSDILATNTLLDPNIQITVGPPSSYTYTYSPTPIIVTVTITSLNTFEPITTNLINMSTSGATIASIALVSSTITTITTNVYNLTLSNGGTFNIQASQPLVPNEYGPSTFTSLQFIIQRATPIVNFPSSFDMSKVYGSPSPYALTAASIISPSPSPPGVSITYQSSSTLVATITGTNVTIVKPGIFQVIANTNQTQNYNSTTTYSPLVIITKSTPIITFTGFITTVVWNSTFTYAFVPPTVTASPLPASPPLPVPSYTIANTSVATISGTTVTLVYPGIFSINATTTETDYYFGTSTNSENVRVVNIPEIISYNNPKVFPRSGGVSGEVGLIIGIPYGSWPVGFTNFTDVTITRVENGSNISLSSSSSPTTYINALDKYLVFGEPSTSTGAAGPFINTLTTSTAPNIALVQRNTIANGATSGVTLKFDFSGGSGSDVPSTFTAIYTTTGAASQGLLFNTYSSITPSTVPPLPSGASQKNSLFVGWKGFGGSGNTNTIQQAWGVSANSSTAPLFSPLIQSGSPPNHTFYPQVQTGVLPDGSNYYYYLGIPKMITPNY